MYVHLLSHDPEQLRHGRLVNRLQTPLLDLPVGTQVSLEAVGFNAGALENVASGQHLRYRVRPAQRWTLLPLPAGHYGDHRRLCSAIVNLLPAALRGDLVFRDHQTRRRVSARTQNGLTVLLSNGLSRLLGLPEVEIGEQGVQAQAAYNVFRGRQLVVLRCQLVPQQHTFADGRVQALGVAPVEPEPDDGFRVHEFAVPYTFTLNEKDVRAICVDFWGDDFRPLSFVAPPLYARLNVALPETGS